MHTFLSKNFAYTRFFACMLLIVLICFKTIGAGLCISSIIKKEVAVQSSEDGEEESPKKAEKSNTEKEKEYFIVGDHHIDEYIIASNQKHCTAYLNLYLSSYIVSITIPPPDISVLHSVI